MRDYVREIRDALDDDAIIVKVNSYLDELRASTSGPEIETRLDVLAVHSVTELKTGLLAVGRALEGERAGDADCVHALSGLCDVLSAASERVERLHEIASE